MDTQRMIFDRKRRLVLPVPAAPGDGAAAARQLDAVLMSVGFKCSGELLGALSGLAPGFVIDQAVKVIGWARELAGVHVAHNTYFADFPANVPDTLEFWAGLIAESIGAQVAAGGEPAIRGVLDARGRFAADLLSLPGYGRYQHSFADLLEHHAAFEPLLADRMTVVHLGGGLDAELDALFAELAGSAVPLTGQGLEDLRVLAEACTGREIPDIRVRENLAVVNAVRVRQGVAPVVKDPTDVLRLAAELSGSDVTLATAPKFASLPRAWRRALLAALDGMDPGKYAGVLAHAEAWKRLGEYLHPGRAVPGQLADSGAELAFAVARGETSVQTLAGHAERAFARHDVRAAAGWLSAAPGMFWRSLDRLLRAGGPEDAALVADYAGRTAPEVSGRVLLSVREHLANRVRRSEVSRIFVGKSGRAWVRPEAREPLDAGLVADLLAVIDEQVRARLPAPGCLVVDPRVLGAAVPLSGKAQTEGLGVWPRGSVAKLEAGDWLRFFFYWKQAARRTDYDLSCQLVTDGFTVWRQLSWTALSDVWGEHSGDVVDAPAPHGATECINVRLDHIPAGAVLIPQLYLYNGYPGGAGGESFGELDENLFGYMTRSGEQRGLPVEARAVRMKTVLRGADRVTLPVMFYRGEDGAFYAKWAHLGMRGRAGFFGGYQAEHNRVSTGLLARAICERQYLQVRYLAGLMGGKAGSVTAWREGRPDVPAGAGQVTFIGVEQPEVLPEGTEVYTLGNLGSLVPA